ncbi:MAG: tetratricopeptide repeat protein [bacterium]
MEKFTQCFLPKFIQQKYQQNNLQGKFQGSSLFVDINDFTGKTEKLFKQGDQGAEEISNLITDIFDLPIKATYFNQGFISGFAGDAFLAVFPDDDGFKMNNALGLISTVFEQERQFKNSVKIGFGSGEMEWGIVGTDDIKTYYFSGSGIDQSVNTKFEDLSKFITPDQRIEIPHTVPMEICSPEIIKVFFSQNLTKYPLRPELRYIIPVFINFGQSLPYEIINNLVALNIKTAQQYKGFFNKIDVSDKGVVTLTIFGAPETREYSEILAIRFAQQVRESFPQIRTGLDFGLAYSGLTGNRFRNEWTVIGDVVNFSARLMMTAKPGEILVSKRFRQKSRSLFSLTDLGSKSIKGKIKSEHIYRFDKISSLKNVKYLTPFIGRSREIKKINDFIINNFNQQSPLLVHIWGEAGIGKTRLINELTNLQSLTEINWIHLKCDQSLSYPWNPFQFWLREIFGIIEENREHFENKISAYLKTISPFYQSYWSYLSALLGYRWKDTIYEQVDEKTRVENQNFILFQIIRNLARSKPLVLIMDDFQWIDELSRAWLEEILQSTQLKTYKFGIVIITREQQLQLKKQSTHKFLKLMLDTLSNKDINNLIEAVLQQKPDTDLESNIVSKVQGNPFFAEQLILSIKYRSPKKSDQDSRLPSSLSEILTARIDQLNQDTRELIKTSSALGSSFNSHLALKLSGLVKNQFERASYDAIDQGVLLLKENNYLTFAHNLLQEAAYQLLLPSDRKKLHLTVVEIIENSPEFSIDKNIGLLYIQTKKSGSMEKWINYADRYSRLLKESYANLDAVKVYTEISEYYRNKSSLQKHLDAELNIAKIYLHLGKITKAKEIFEHILKQLKEYQDHNLLIKTLNGLGEVFYKTGNYESAFDHINQAHSISKEYNHEEGQLDSMNSLAMIYKIKNEFNKSIYFYQQVLELTAKINNKEKELRTQVNLSALYNQKGDFDQAEKYLHICLDNPELNNYKLLQAGVYNNMGILQINKSNYSLALEYLKKSMQANEEIGDISNLAATKHNIGDIYIDLGNSELAEKNLQQSLEMHRMMGQKFGEMQSLISLGALYEEQLDKALDYYQQALKIAENYNYQREKIQIQINIAEAYRVAGKTDIARGKLNIILEKVKEIKDDNLMEIIRNLITQIETEEKN